MLKYLLPTLLLAGYAVCQTRPAVAEQAHDIPRSARKDSNPDVRKEATTALSLAGIQQASYLQLLPAGNPYDPGCMLVTCIESLVESKVPVMVTFWPA